VEQKRADEAEKKRNTSKKMQETRAKNRLEKERLRAEADKRDHPTGASNGGQSNGMAL